MNITIEEFIRTNIKEINNKISNFKNTTSYPYTDIDIKRFLKTKLFEETKNLEFKNKLLQELDERNFKKSKIVDIANEYIFYKPDLEKFYETIIFDELQKKVQSCQTALTQQVVGLIGENLNMDKRHFDYIRSDLIKVLYKSLFISSMNGFPMNIVNVESGVMTANAGDSAQFLFLSRAILAGYNASNVDVRSSRYDAVIDHNGIILKVQVKGISSNTVSFKDRDRGGQGIDHTHERNIGKRITSYDCDIYAAVDKQAGICYIVPMKAIDILPLDVIKSMNVSDIEIYKENWSIIDKVCESKKKPIYTQQIQ